MWNIFWCDYLVKYQEKLFIDVVCETSVVLLNSNILIGLSKFVLSVYV